MPAKSSNRARIKIAQRRRNTRRATIHARIAKQHAEKSKLESYRAAKAAAAAAAPASDVE